MTNIMNFNESHMRKNFAKKYKDKTFFKRYVWHYNLLVLPEVLALLVSALLSLKWWQYQPVIQDYFGTYSLVIAALCTLSISVAIWLFTAHQLPLMFTEKQADIFIVPLLALIAFNFYTDWNGVPQLAQELHQKPTYQNIKEEQLNQEIQDIYKAYLWCGVHNSKHDCEHAVMPHSPGQIKDVYARYGFKPAQDRQTILTIQNQLNRMNSDYLEAKEVAIEKQNRFTSSGRGGTIACIIIFLAITWWRHQFEYKTQGNINANFPSIESNEMQPPIDENLRASYDDLLKTIKEHQQKFQNQLKDAKTNMISNAEKEIVPVAGTTGTSDLEETVVQNRSIVKPNMIKKKCEADDCNVHFWYNESKLLPNPKKYCSENCKNKMSSKKTIELRLQNKNRGKIKVI